MLIVAVFVLASSVSALNNQTSFPLLGDKELWVSLGDQELGIFFNNVQEQVNPSTTGSIIAEGILPGPEEPIIENVSINETVPSYFLPPVKKTPIVFWLCILGVLITILWILICLLVIWASSDDDDDKNS